VRETTNNHDAFSNRKGPEGEIEEDFSKDFTPLKEKLGQSFFDD
jgi:hypothetical protein